MYRWMLISALFLAALPLRAQDAGGLAGVEDAFVRAVEKARASVVAVTSEFEVPSKGEKGDGEADTFRISFSGVVLDAQGHILTVASAARNARTVVVTTADESEYEAEVIGIDDRSNLAVLKIDAESLVPVEFADPKTVHLGSWVIAVGNAFGMSGTVSYGLVSGLDRTLGTGETVLTNMVQTTACVNPGDSGGLLANSRGQLVGVIASTFQRAASMSSIEEALSDMGGPSMESLMKDLQDLQTGGANDPKRLRDMMSRWMRSWAKKSREQGKRQGGVVSGQLLGAEGVNFATPAETVKFVADQLVEKGKVDRGWLGVEVRAVPSGLRKKLGIPAGATGLLVGRVVKDGPAEKGGLRPDDVILKMNGSPLARMSDLERFVARSTGGTQLTIEVSSDGERKEIVITLGTRPEDPEDK